jgi:hypothetical protein
VCRARRTVAGLAVLTALLLTAAVAAAEADARGVCCFRVTVDITGDVNSDYGSSDPGQGDYTQGFYFYGWGGTAYGLARYNHGRLSSERGVASGYVAEGGSWKIVDSQGQEDPAAEQRACTPSPAHHSSGGDGQTLDIPLTKTKAGSPDIGVAGTQFLQFGNPYSGWEVPGYNCYLGDNSNSDLRGVNPHWQNFTPFFDYHYLSGVSDTKLRHGGSQQLLCFEHGRRVLPERTTAGLYALYINIVHFPASKEKANLRRLHHKLGTPTPQNNPAQAAQNKFASQGRAGKVPVDGCHPYQG